MTTIRGMISTCPDQQHHQDGSGSGWFRNHTRIETPGICHQSFRMPPRIDDLGLGELPVDSAQDRALAGLLCAGNGLGLKPGESGRWRDGSGTGSGCVGLFRPSSGDHQVRLRGSIWWMGACSVMSGVIVSPAGISGPAPGRSFVRSFVCSGGGWLVGGCATDMHCRYGATI